MKEVYLFFGGHGDPRLPPDQAVASEDKDAILATKKIKKTTRWINNKRKILLVECTYTDFRKNLYNHNLTLKEEQLKEDFDRLVIWFDNIKRKIQQNEQ